MKCKSCGKKLTDSDSIIFLSKKFYHESCVDLVPKEYAAYDKKSSEFLGEVESYRLEYLDLSGALEIKQDEGL